MMLTLAGLRGMKLHATDGRIGHVHDVLFEDTNWLLRYFVVDAGSWLFGRRVLITPAIAGPVSGPEPDELPVAATRDEIKASPDIDADRPVSRQMEARLYSHYGWAPYWTFPGAGIAADGLVPPLLVPGPDEAPPTAEPAGDPHLRSAREVEGYAIAATDGDIGHVADFLIDPEGWAVRYLLVETGTWLAGRKVLVATGWVAGIDWSERRARVDLTRDAIKNSPDYDPARPLGRTDEERLHAHYGVRPYW